MGEDEKDDANAGFREKRKVGRPRKGDAKKYLYGVKISESEVEMLNYINRMEGKSAADIFREGLRMSYNLTRSRH